MVASIVELLDEEKNYLELNGEKRNAKEPKDGIISLVKKYKDLLKVANRKIITIVGKQSELLKIFSDLISKQIFGRVGLSNQPIQIFT